MRNHSATASIPRVGNSLSATPRTLRGWSEPQSGYLPAVPSPTANVSEAGNTRAASMFAMTGKAGCGLAVYCPMQMEWRVPLE